MFKRRATHSRMVYSKSLLSDRQRVIQQVCCFFVFVLVSVEKNRSRVLRKTFEKKVNRNFTKI